MPEIIRAGTDADFLALLPALVGMRLRRSLVLVTFAGTRTIHGARFDLPDRRDTRSMRSLADACVSLAARNPDADGVSLVVVTDSSFEAERGIPWHGLARELDARMGRAGFRIVSMLCTASDGWGRYDARGDDRGPWPLAEIAASSAGGRAAALESALDDPGALAALPVEEPALFPAIDEAIDAIIDEWDRAERDRAEGSGVDPHDLVPRAAAAVVHDRVESVLEAAIRSGAAAVAPDGLGLLAAYAAMPSWRDTLTLQIAFGRELGERAAEQQRLWNRRRSDHGGTMDDVVTAALAAGEASGDDADALIIGEGDRRPDLDRCLAGIGVLLRAAANVEEPARPGLLCMAGWLCWATGRASAAALLLDEALAIEPGHRMSRLIRTLVVAGAVPEWAFATDDG